MSRSRRKGAIFYGAVSALLGTIVAVTARLTVERQKGRGKVAPRLPDGPLIIVANHTSYADGMLLMLACRRLGRSVRLLAKSGLFKVPVLGAAIRRLGFIPVDRASATANHALDLAAHALARGEAVGLFPEGRITENPNGWPERAKTGAVRLALRTGAPIVPVAMAGADRLVGRKRIVLGLLVNVLRRPQVTLKVGDPLDARALVGGSDDPGPEAVREASALVMRHLVDLLAAVRDEHPEHPTVGAAGDAP